MKLLREIRLLRHQGFQGLPRVLQEGLPPDHDARRPTQHTYVAGAKLDENGVLVTSGGRVTGTTAVADTLEAAIREAYRLSDGRPV